MALENILTDGTEKGLSAATKINAGFTQNDENLSSINTNTANITTNTVNILTNINDITALDGRVTVNEGNITTLLAPDSTVYNDMSGIEPSYLQGQLYYADGVMKVQDGYSDVTLDIGRQLHMQVVNTTGATILKGKACKRDGVTAGIIKAALAIADTFINANVIGVAAHDIPDGTTGILTIFGEIKDYDTTANTAGLPLFLSATVPGEYTNTAPIIRTKVGGTIESTLTGRMFVNISNNEPLPRILGSLLEATAPTILLADLINGTPISNYLSKIEIATDVNLVTGIITVPLDGTYRLNVSMHTFFDNVGNNGKKEIYLDLRDVTANTVVKSIKSFILTSAETWGINDNGAVDLLGTHEYRLEMRSELELTTFAFSASTFYLESIIY